MTFVPKEIDWAKIYPRRPHDKILKEAERITEMAMEKRKKSCLNKESKCQK